MNENQVLSAATSPEVVELLNQVRQTAPVLTKILRRLEEVNRSGALDTLFDMAQVLQAAQVSMSDGMIARVANAGRLEIEMKDLLATSGLVDKLPGLIEAVTQARREAENDRQFLGPVEFLTAPKDPEVQLFLKFVLALARRLPRAM